MSDPSLYSAPMKLGKPVACSAGFALYRRGKFWEVVDAIGELVCITVYKCGAREVVRRLAGPPPEPPAGIAELLVRIQSPNGLEDLADALDELELRLRTEPEVWRWECNMAFHESMLAMLLARARFQALVLTAQHSLIESQKAG